MSTETLEKPKEKVKSMFGEVDRKHLFDRETGEYKGKKIASSYPAYMQKVAKEKLKQAVDEREDSLSLGQVSSSALEYTKRMLKKEKNRLAEIESSVPEFTPSEATHLKNSFLDLEKEVASAQYTEKDMETGKGIDPAEEARRMSEPCIHVDKWVAETCNVKIDAKTGMITRSEGEKILKIVDWHLRGGDEPYLLENLRRKQGGHARKASQVTIGIDLKEMEIKNRIKELEQREKMLIDELQAVKAKSEKAYPEWKCEEDGCDFVGTTKNKGIHQALHVRQANKARRENEMEVK